LKSRCSWSATDPLYIKYHDKEWGVPLHDDRRLFEFLILDGAQAGLSWFTVLKKRQNYRKAFDHYKFVGPTICYAFMQAAGLVNDHVVDCFRYEEV